MSDTAVETPTSSEEESGGLHAEEKQYLVVALILAILTGLEVGVYYIKRLPHPALIGMLGILAILKFVMVVLYFMHLKFDSRFFARLFSAGLALAIGVYVVVLSAFHVFTGGNPVLH